jgi:epoxyqueuosine reductase
MDYLSTKRAKLLRYSPLHLASWAQSILFLGACHPSPRSTPLEKPSNVPFGRVASYAWGLDYHKLLSQKIQALIPLIGKMVGHKLQHRIHTDSAPVLERSLAVKAGLGWIGRNSCLIHPNFGSFFLLAECFLDFNLEPENQYPIHDHCASCNRCINACPTQCILPNRTIDSRRCIAYLTIENKGIIPRELRPKIGNWVFGCDICQMVCPWNKHEDENLGLNAFVLRTDIPFPILHKELEFSPEIFSEKYQKTPFIRARYRGFLRNLIVAAGNVQDENSIPNLTKRLNQEIDPLIRGHAVWALAQFPSSALYTTINKMLKQENDPFVLDEIHFILDNRT